MTSRLSSTATDHAAPAVKTLRRPEQGLERRGWQNWVLVLSLLLLVTLGLGAALVSLVTTRELPLWPWKGSEPVLLAGLSLVVMLFGVYLTYQQRHLQHLRRELLRAHEATVIRTKRHYGRLMALYGVSQALARETRPQDIFRRIVKMGLDLFEADQVSLMLLDRSTGELVVREAQGHLHLNQVVGSRQKQDTGIAGWVAQHRISVNLGPRVSPDQFPEISQYRDDLTASLVVPILVRDELVGVLNVSSRSSGTTYSQEDLQALQVFAGNVGVAIRHAEQADWMRQTIRTLEESRGGVPPGEDGMRGRRRTGGHRAPAGGRG